MTRQRPLYIPYAGPNLLETPLLNKGSAFSHEEREAFNLAGLLPPRYESIEEQVERCYMQYSGYSDAMNKHIYLRAIQDTNETLYYRLVQTYLEEMMPIIYTPTVGDACEQFSDIYRSARGLFLAYSERDQMQDILRNATKKNVKIIVVTDGERILGLGDQGLGGMGIPIGKLALYTACGGISPAYTLPVMLDVGTNNEKLLNDRRYMGSRHPRVSQEEYDDFVDIFLREAQERWPGVMIQFEDFAQHNAMPILKRYRKKVCCFNDDIQGTAAVTAGTLLAACRVKGVKLSDQKIVFAGAGSAGCGIAEQLIREMVAEGCDETKARAQVFMIDRYGLLVDGMSGLRLFQQELVQSPDAVADWESEGDYPSLKKTVEQAKPDVLIGVSGQPGLFTEELIKTMHANCERPTVLILSNPSRKVEAQPADVIEWTDGQALIATGSPFKPVEYKGQSFPIPQCNNSYIFPGIGLGVLAVKASRISNEMIMAASAALVEASPLVQRGQGSLLPPFTYHSVSINAENIGTRNATYSRTYRYPLKKYGSTYIMVYSGFIEERGIRCVWLAHSKDAENWEQLKMPLVEPIEGEMNDCYGPSLFRWKGRNYLVYQDHTSWRGGNLKYVELDQELNPVGAGGKRHVLLDPPDKPPLNNRYRGAAFYFEDGKIYLYSSASKTPRLIVYAVASLEHPVVDELKTLKTVSE